MILIVDDRPENILSLSSILKFHSFEVDSAASGEEALKKTLKNDYSLIILDVQMPMMDGFEVAEFLSGNNNTREIPIIFLSAVSTEKKFITKGYSSGAIDYIIKPIDPDILILKVKTLHKLYEQKRELNLAQQKLQAEVEFRKKAQQQLSEKAHELNSILTSIPQVAFTATAAGVVDFVNDHWYAYSISISNFPQAHPDDFNFSTCWHALLEKKEMVEKEIRIAKIGSNHYKYHLLRIVPVIENGVLVKWVGTFTDIDEQKQAIKSKDEFLGMVSHELKTPLTTISGYVQLLDAVLENNEHSEFAKKAMGQVAKLDRLVNDLLDMSSLENGKLNFSLKPMQFETLFNTTVEMLRLINPGTIIHPVEPVAATVNANAFRIEQVMINFVSNAIKYSPRDKPVEIITKITADNRVYFGVKDQGIGIAPERQASVFNKFYRVPESASYAQGLGIGLYICSQILDMHEATYGVESEFGKGSLFYFTLPVVDI
ncbi:MAG: response regulator [Sphingobacteriales bacterium]|nr:MAG: response regulator [Sphingobacteriales bacterium]